MKILVMNAGSSSQKSTLYELLGDRLPSSPPVPLWVASIDWTHQAGQAEIKVDNHQGTQVQETMPNQPREAVMARFLETLWSGETQVIEKPYDIDIVGHRVVHGGAEYQASVRITPEVKEAIARFSHYAPVHNPANLEGIEFTEKILGNIPQVAVFDTAFHATLPQFATVYPIPYHWYEAGIRRYGFHGTSHRYCAARAAELLGHPMPLRLIICHLGNGASLSAVRDGECIDTTMGFTPLEGLMMGSRSGSIDPGILIHLLREEGFDADKLDRLLNKESGVLGVSGVSNDMRQVTEAIAQGNAQAQLALDVYLHRLRQSIGSLLPGLGGLDAIVFTAGIGENAPDIRAGACQGFEFLGLKIDPEKNVRSPQDIDIATHDSTVRALAIHTQEDWMIVSDAWTIARAS
ncbi:MULTISPECIES: acetate kinase [unclassified Leptolyngbya]|uniref:acetate kinase n=1 Tax=unclassified Leptolyngbya TaxID=2650499 RepID=UPI0016879D29|nr:MULTISPECIES: acetate kinase [unclassified Leptolyngbya]MBD1913505.1 acetate kinase [Leptolyngbya sp. FACHB-8]MBD2153273.1 acetate kinase [Leptolyngbya sp. FACHB-16]